MELIYLFSLFQKLKLKIELQLDRLSVQLEQSKLNVSHCHKGHFYKSIVRQVSVYALNKIREQELQIQDIDSFDECRGYFFNINSKVSFQRSLVCLANICLKICKNQTVQFLWK